MLRPSLLLGATALLVACGSADFTSGGAKKKGTADLRREDDEVLVPSDQPEDQGNAGSKVTWKWSCDAKASDETKRVAPMIEGAGTFVAEDGVPSYQIDVLGEPCAAALTPRDVLFVFDASTSMAFNDPKKNDSCNRLRAIEAVAKAYEGKTDARFGLVAFSRDNSRLTLASAGFFASAAELEASLTTQEGETVGEVVCGSNHLGTNYDVAFGEAAEFVRLHANPAVETAIFFVSDGKPTFGHTGASPVATLKQAGVTINTVAVRGKESLMRDQIASRDARGLPLHVDVDDADKLADALVQLNQGMTVPGRFSFRAKGATDWTSADVPTSFVFDEATYGDGMEVQYEYAGPAGKVQVPAALSWPEG